MFIAKKPKDKYWGLLPDMVLDQILSEYDFLNTWIVLPFININDRPISINRRSETAKKAVILYNDKLFILKEIPWYCSDIDFVTYELKYQRLLHDSGFVIPKIYYTNSGALFCHLNYDDVDRYFFLQDYVLGNSWSKSLHNGLIIGETLASIHNISKDLFENDCQEGPRGNIFDLALKMLDVLKITLEEKRSEIEQDNIIYIDNFILKSTHRIIENKNKASKLNYFNIYFPIHGDFNPWNLIFIDYQIKAILDFDNSIVDNPIHDLAESILDFSFFEFKDQRTRLKSVAFNVDKDYAKDILLSYLSNLDPAIRKSIYCLPLSVSTIAIELFALGLVRGDFIFKECDSIFVKIDQLESEIETLTLNMVADYGILL